MKRYFVLLIGILLFSCSKPVEKPKTMLSKDEMAAIIADFAIYDQSYTVNPDVNMEAVSRYVLKSHHTDAKVYRENYKYYLSNPDMLEDIINQAQEIVIEKDPSMEVYIEKKKKENPDLPSFAR